eukprot:672957-Rhodomonas_salina.1
MPGPVRIVRKLRLLVFDFAVEERRWEREVSHSMTVRRAQALVRLLRRWLLLPVILFHLSVFAAGTKGVGGESHHEVTQACLEHRVTLRYGRTEAGVRRSPQSLRWPLTGSLRQG